MSDKDGRKCTYGLLAEEKQSLLLLCMNYAVRLSVDTASWDQAALHFRRKRELIIICQLTELMI